jgi:hypothetical protein
MRVVKRAMSTTITAKKTPAEYYAAVQASVASKADQRHFVCYLKKDTRSHPHEKMPCFYRFTSQHPLLKHRG